MISALVNTWNEEKNIRNCLSCLKWCDEIIVVDMHSTDRTREIASEFTDRIYLHEYIRYVEPARKFGVGLAQGDWVFILDADEMITPELAELLKVSCQDKNLDVISIPRKNYMFGKWIRSARIWPDYQIRFFRKGKVSFSDRIHTYPKTLGAVRKLPAEERLAIIHFNYTNLADFVERLNRYTDIEAKNLRDLGENYTLPEAFLNSNKEFFSCYILRGGFKAGWRGFFLSLSMGYYKFLSYFKYRERCEQDDCRLNVEYDYLERSEHVLQQWSDFVK